MEARLRASAQAALTLGMALAASSALAQFDRAALVAAPVPLEIRPDGEWRGLLGAGFTASGGNTRSMSLNLVADAVRATPVTRLSMSAQALYGRSRVAETTTKTADQWRLGARHDWRRDGAGAYFFTTGSAERDALRRLSLRATAGLGLGYRHQFSPDHSAEVFGGLGWRDDRYAAPGNTVQGELRLGYRTAEAMLGEESLHRLSSSTSFQQRVMILPNLDRQGEFRASFESVLSVAMTRNLILTVSLSDRFDSQASAPLRRNDVLLFTGVNLRLGAR